MLSYRTSGAAPCAVQPARAAGAAAGWGLGGRRGWSAGWFVRTTPRLQAHNLSCSHLPRFEIRPTSRHWALDPLPPAAPLLIAPSDTAPCPARRLPLWPLLRPVDDDRWAASRPDGGCRNAGRRRRRRRRRRPSRLCCLPGAGSHDAADGHGSAGAIQKEKGGVGVSSSLEMEAGRKQGKEERGGACWGGFGAMQRWPGAIAPCSSGRRLQGAAHAVEAGRPGSGPGVCPPPASSRVPAAERCTPPLGSTPSPPCGPLEPAPTSSLPASLASLVSQLSSSPLPPSCPPFRRPRAARSWPPPPPAGLSPPQPPSQPCPPCLAAAPPPLARARQHPP